MECKLICIIHTYMYVYIYICGGLKLLGEVGTWKSAGFIVPSAALDIIFIYEYSIYLHTHTHTYTHTFQKRQRVRQTYVHLQELRSLCRGYESFSWVEMKGCPNQRE